MLIALAVYFIYVIFGDCGYLVLLTTGGEITYANLSPTWSSIIGFYQRYRTGDLIAHATNDVDKVILP